MNYLIEAAEKSNVSRAMASERRLRPMPAPLPQSRRPPPSPDLEKGDNNKLGEVRMAEQHRTKSTCSIKSHIGPIQCLAVGLLFLLVVAAICFPPSGQSFNQGNFTIRQPYPADNRSNATVAAVNHNLSSIPRLEKTPSTFEVLKSHILRFANSTADGNSARASSSTTSGAESAAPFPVATADQKPTPSASPAPFREWPILHPPERNFVAVTTPCLDLTLKACLCILPYNCTANGLPADCCSSNNNKNNNNTSINDSDARAAANPAGNLTSNTTAPPLCCQDITNDDLVTTDDMYESCLPDADGLYRHHNLPNASDPSASFSSGPSPLGRRSDAGILGIFTSKGSTGEEEDNTWVDRRGAVCRLARLLPGGGIDLDGDGGGGGGAGDGDGDGDVRLDLAPALGIAAALGLLCVGILWRLSD